MRETKFRGKRLDNGEWQIGDLITFCDAQGNIHRCFIHLRMSPVGFTEPALASTVCLYEVDPNTVGQFTGLIDKTKTEIYEGDIIRECYTIFPDDMEVFISEVLFQNGSFQLSGEDYEPFSGESSMCSIKSTDLEVIGNVWENPELLGGAA